MWAAARSIRIGIREYLQAIRGGILLGALVAGMAWLVDSKGPALGATQALTRLALDASACLLVCLLAIKLVPEVIGDNLSSLIRNVADKLPAAIARPLLWFCPDPSNK